MAITDSLTARVPMRAPSLSDSLALTENAVLIQRILSSISDSQLCVEGLTAMVPIRAPISDNVAGILLDALVASLVELGSATPLSYSFADDLASNIIDLASVILSHRVTAVDSMLPTEAMAAKMVDFGFPVDSFLPVEGMASIQRHFGILSDTLALSDGISAIQIIRAQYSETLSITDGLLSLLTIRAQISDDTSLVLLDSLIASLVDISSATPLSYSFSESMSLAENIDALQNYKAEMSEQISILDSLLGALALNYSISEEAYLSESFSCFIWSAGEALPLSFSFSDSLDLQDSAAVLERIRARASEVIGISESASALLRQFCNISDFELIFDSIVSTFQVTPHPRHIRIYAANGINVMVFSDIEPKIRTSADDHVKVRTWIN
jgi:hypothetical protein